MSQKRYQNTILVSLAILLVGLAVACTQYKASTILTAIAPDFSLDGTMVSWVMSVFTFVGIFVALPSGKIAQTFGFKKAIVTSMTVLIIGSLIFALPCIAFSVQMVNSAMQENGTVFEVTDAYEAELTSQELNILLPNLVEYRIGTEDRLDVDDGELQQRVIATVVTTSELSREEQQP